MLLLDMLYPLDDEGGRITIGGTDIRKIRTEHLRRNIGIVLQEPFLFSRTIGENIGIAAADADMDAIREAAAAAVLDETIGTFAAGYDTMVGERGVTLSGDQKQRAAIARTLNVNTPILIFDDSLSAVDTETDAKIRRAIQQRFGKASVIIISHRITTLSAADKILVLDRGRIAEEGTHEQLKCAGGIYQRIYETQSGTKQLISFARAILADLRILILDEATASVDTITEAKIQNAMETVTAGRTSIMIAHRLSTVRNADMILVVRNGKIVEQGTHDALLKKQGYYHELYTRQYEDEATAQILA